MNKKLFGTALLGLLLSAATGTFVSCKDYDDDIENLQNQINGLKPLESSVSELKSSLAGVQSTCQTNINAAIENLKNGDVKKALEDAAKAQASASDAAAEAGKALAAANDKSAVDAALVDAKAYADAAVKAANDLAVIAKAAADAAQAAADNAQGTANGAQSAADAAQNAANAAQNTANGAQSAADAAQNAANAAQNTANGAQSAADAAQNAANAAQNTANEALAAAQAAAQAAAEAAAAGALTQDQIDALNSIATLAQKVAAVENLKSEILEEVDAKIAALRTEAMEIAAEKINEINAAIAELQKAASTIIGKRLTSLVYAPDTYINGIEAIEFVNLEYIDWGTDPELWLNNVQQEFTLADDGENYKLLPGQVVDFGTKATYLVSPAAVKMDGIESLTFRTKNAVNTRAADAKDLHISVIDPSIDNGELTIYLKKTITGLEQTLPKPVVVNAVATKYYGDLVANGISADTHGRIDGNNGKIYFDGNVKGDVEVNIKDKDKSYNGSSASAYFDGAVKFGSYVKFDNLWLSGYINLNGGEYTFKNVSIEANGETTPTKDPMIIAALEAKLAESVLDESEKGNEVSVFSDWARVRETTEIPFIHNNDSRDYNGTPDCDVKAGAHFWFFSDIYKDGTWKLNGFANERTQYSIDEGLFGINAVYLNDKDAPAESVGAYAEYNKVLNLFNLVTVCTQDVNGKFSREITKEEMKRYGLEFEFHKLDYWVKNYEDGKYAKDSTNQADFAKLDELKGELTPCSEGGLEFNANAIGHTPVIQVVLRDTKKDDDPENDQIIDVRYFKVQWTAEAEGNICYDKPFDFTYGFECGSYSDGWVYEKAMNLFYATVINGGIGKTQFWAKYNLEFPNKTGNIYRSDINLALLSKEELDAYQKSYNWKKVNNVIGTVTYQKDESASSQTENLELEFDAYQVNPRKAKGNNQDAYKDGGVEGTDFEFTGEKQFTQYGFFVFENVDKTGSKIFVPVVLNVKENTIKSQYEVTQWNDADGNKYADNTQPTSEEVNKFRNINPILRSDKVYGIKDNSGKDYVTTQLRGSITKGYLYNGQEPASIYGLSVVEWAEGTRQADEKKAYDPATTDINFDKAQFDVLYTYLPKDEEWVKAHQGYKWFTISGKDLYFAKCTPKASGRYDINDIEEGSLGAVIDPATGEIYLVDNQDNGELTASTLGELFSYPTKGVPTDAALLLVGHQVPVKVTAKQCGKTEYDMKDHDWYWFDFIRPLIWKEHDTDVTLTDIVEGGQEKPFKLSDALELVENYGQQNSSINLFKAALTPGSDEAKKQDALWNWYGIDVIGIDKDNVMTNLNVDGTIDNTFDTPLKSILSNKTDKYGKYLPLYDVQFGIEKEGQETGAMTNQFNEKKNDDETYYQVASSVWDWTKHLNADKDEITMPTAAEYATIKAKEKLEPKDPKNQDIVYATNNDGSYDYSVNPMMKKDVPVKSKDGTIETKISYIDWGSEATNGGYTYLYSANTLNPEDAQYHLPAYEIAANGNIESGYYMIPLSVLKKVSNPEVYKIDDSQIVMKKVTNYYFTTQNEANKAKLDAARQQAVTAAANAYKVLPYYSKAYKYGDKYYTEQNGKGLEVVDAENAHYDAATKAWYLGKQHDAANADKETPVAVYVTMDDEDGAMDNNNNPL